MTAPSGCSSTGATSTMSSSSSASRHRLRQAARYGKRRLHQRLGPRPARRPEPGHAELQSTNGRVWKMVLDPNDPTIVTSLSVFVEGDDNAVKTLNEIHQPDNIETTANGILLTEDPGSSQQFALTDQAPNATTARLWYVPFSGTPSVVAKLDQSADGRGDRRRWAHRRQLGRMGIDRDRGRLGSFRARHVPDQRPGSYALGREGGR